MKTAVSIPDIIYESAEKLANRSGISRSKLYARALESYMAQQDEQAITQRLDELYAEANSKLDPALRKSQVRTISGSKEVW